MADTSLLRVECSPAMYSASLIARAVEDCDARLLNLNVTGMSATEPLMSVLLRVSHRDPERVSRSLERYGFSVADARGDDSADERLRSNYDHLMHLLDL
ncbi:MAG: hypothetical protein NC406_05185 [Bacteroides sp.]|nr:hypothetical protein [Bacteroides sp.]MCM1096425.1 hypothetical protein [Terasakiella sp.]